MTFPGFLSGILLVTSFYLQRSLAHEALSLNHGDEQVNFGQGESGDRGELLLLQDVRNTNIYPLAAEEAAASAEAVDATATNKKEVSPLRRWKRSCIVRGGNCVQRADECCGHSSSCRCNLWGTNCRCQRTGLFQNRG